jgi:hypothetical protein
MYPMNNGVTGTSRLPRGESRTSTDGVPPNTLGRAIGGAVLQAAAIVIVAKIVDVAVDAFMNRRRAQQHQPQRSRREEAVGA